MSKKFKGQLCPYCCKNISTTKDHVVARSFLLTELRDQLPDAPACNSCNNLKSKIEHYLVSTLGFGGRHADASRVLQEIVAKSIDKNLKLKRLLSAGISHYLYSENNREWHFGIRIPLDAKKIEELAEYVIKGLAWHFWKVYFDPEICLIKTAYLNSLGVKYFESLLGQSGNHLSLNFGHGAFKCDAIQSTSNPKLTVWKMSFYGAEVSGDIRDPLTKTSYVYGITAPRSFSLSNQIEAMFG